MATMEDNFGPDLDQLPRSVINGQCSTSSSSTVFSFWLRVLKKSFEGLGRS